MTNLQPENAPTPPAAPKTAQPAGQASPKPDPRAKPKPKFGGYFSLYQ